ncbi:type IV secretory system conjugative DNA transfer family protein [Geodermatophilus sp. SYSU D01176]
MSAAAAMPKWLRHRFPVVVEPGQLTALLRCFHGLGSDHRERPVAFQAVGHAGHVDHFLRLPPQRRTGLLAQARSTVPGLTLEPSDGPQVGQPQAAWRLWSSSSRLPLRTDEPAAVSQAVLTALAEAGAGERVTLQWLLGPVRRPVVVPSRHSPVLSESWPRALASAPFKAPAQLDAEARRALRSKQGEAGWRLVGRIAVQAANRERRFSLLGQLLGALRTAEGPGARLGVRPVKPSTVTTVRTPLFWGLACNVQELTALLAWPLGELPLPPVARRPSRLLPVPPGVPTTGRIIAVEPLNGRTIALTPKDSAQHLWALGPTGTGKSTVLLNLITQDMAAGRAVVVLEPKGDLISDVLARVPPARQADVVLLDPADEAPVGLNPLATRTAPELVADQLLTVLARLNAESWGPRLAELLHASLLTLARTPGMSLAVLPPLLTNPGFRRRVVGALDDPLGVSPIWAAFERLSDEAQAQTVAAVLNKVRALTARPALRAVLGQVEPRFALPDLFSSRRPILLANLAKGVIGPDSARLLGTLLLNQLWQAALGRQAIPPERRHLVSVVVDELQDYASLPGDLGDMLAQARGLGVMFSLACQHLDQLAPALRSGALANARTRVVFQTAADDARVLARGHKELTPEDFTHLAAHEVYLRLSVGAAVTSYMSGETRPAPPVVSDPAAIRGLSRERYGVPRLETDTALQALIDGPRGGDRPIGRSRRPS